MCFYFVCTVFTTVGFGKCIRRTTRAPFLCPFQSDIPKQNPNVRYLGRALRTGTIDWTATDKFSGLQAICSPSASKSGYVWSPQSIARMLQGIPAGMALGYGGVQAALGRLVGHTPRYSFWHACYSLQVFAVFMMCTAACVFGLILGELQEIYAAANSKVCRYLALAREMGCIWKLCLGRVNPRETSGSWYHDSVIFSNYLENYDKYNKIEIWFKTVLFQQKFRFQKISEFCPYVYSRIIVGNNVWCCLQARGFFEASVKSLRSELQTLALIHTDGTHCFAVDRHGKWKTTWSQWLCSCKRTSEPICYIESNQFCLDINYDILGWHCNMALCLGAAYRPQRSSE